METDQGGRQLTEVWHLVEGSVATVRSLQESPWDDGDRYEYGTGGCFQPTAVLKDGDRLVFDLGKGRALHLEQLVLGLAAMDGKPEEVQLLVETAESFGAGAEMRGMPVVYPEGCGDASEPEHTPFPERVGTCLAGTAWCESAPRARAEGTSTSSGRRTSRRTGWA